jgi:hypothetical protein
MVVERFCEHRAHQANVVRAGCRVNRSDSIAEAPLETSRTSRMAAVGLMKAAGLDGGGRRRLAWRFRRAGLDRDPSSSATSMNMKMTFFARLEVRFRGLAGRSGGSAASNSASAKMRRRPRSRRKLRRTRMCGIPLTSSPLPRDELACVQQEPADSGPGFRRNLISAPGRIPGEGAPFSRSATRQKSRNAYSTPVDIVRPFSLDSPRPGPLAKNGSLSRFRPGAMC